MTREQRRKQLHGRIYIFCLILITMTVLIIFTLSKSETYAIESESNTTHYKYVKQYTLDATYIGDGNFVDENGNEWAIDEEDYTKGKVYSMTMHDNATPDNIEDDVIVDIY